jgi:hypothetical protein
MRRVIMLLPNPDNLQLANCHKYVSRAGEKGYSDIYTMTTVLGKCADVEKMLVIGHGDVGGFLGASVDEVVAAIIGSGISLTTNHKIAFDTCYAGTRSDTGNLSSALHAVRVRLKKANFDCNLHLSGATGPSVTVGNVGDKRLVVKPAKLPAAGKVQKAKVKFHHVDLFGHRGDWSEGATSATIKKWASEEHAKLLGFALDFRAAIAPLLDTTGGRKVSLQV